MRSRQFADFMLDAWTKRGLIAWLLLPVTAIYWILSGIRRSAYRLGFVTSQKVDPLVIVVGNVIAGGAGKTPTTICVVNHLRSLGYRVGVVSRGYGRTNTQTCLIEADSTPDKVGDEPLLIHLSTGVPVAVGQKRYDAAVALTKRHPDLQVLVCDDGLQHFSLFRDIEICVFDDRGTGNGWLLPSGPLRENWPPHPIAKIGQSEEGPLVLTTWVESMPAASGANPSIGAGFTAKRLLADFGVSVTGEQISLEDVVASSRPVAALAGIARPEVFFEMLKLKGVGLSKTFALDDHAEINSAELGYLGDHTLLCTEKDAAKLWPRFSQALSVPLQLDIDPGFFTALEARVQSVLSAQISSRHGHKIT